MITFGLQLPVQSQSTVFVQAWEPAAGVTELVQAARSCEAAGFDYVALGHLHRPQVVGRSRVKATSAATASPDQS